MAQVNKNIGVIVARMVSESGALDVAAEKVAAKARSNASAISKTGQYASSFATEKVPGKKGVVDTVAYNDDPGAAAIEFGHMQGDTFVPGHYVMSQAARS